MTLRVCAAGSPTDWGRPWFAVGKGEPHLAPATH